MRQIVIIKGDLPAAMHAAHNHKVEIEVRSTRSNCGVTETLAYVDDDYLDKLTDWYEEDDDNTAKSELLDGSLLSYEAA